VVTNTKKAKTTNKAKKTNAGPESKTYPCTFFSQRANGKAPSFCVFAASAGEVLEWSDIERLGPGVKGVQRRENVAKRKQITKFFENEANTIPTAVIIALDQSKVSADEHMLTIPLGAGSKKAGLVIDGQHRLLGTSDFDANIKVPVVAIMNASDIEKAFQFLVINNKGSKVSQNHIKALALTFNPTDLSSRLKGAKIALDSERLAHVEIINGEGSPFANRVDFPTTKGTKKKVVPEAFERSLQYIESLNLPKLDDHDVQRDFFITIWKALVSAWSEVAVFEDDCKLTEKVGVICMTRYLVDRLSAMADLEELDLDLSDFVEVGKHVQRLLNRQVIEFWNAKWKGAGYDTGLGHAKVLEALVRISRNIKEAREWHTDVDIL
jgi:DGQHR domain-containing protein